MCMCIKNFCWTETGKNVLKIKEGRGGGGVAVRCYRYEGFISVLPKCGSQIWIVQKYCTNERLV